MNAYHLPKHLLFWNMWISIGMVLRVVGMLAAHLEFPMGHCGTECRARYPSAASLSQGPQGKNRSQAGISVVGPATSEKRRKQAKINAEVVRAVVPRRSATAGQRIGRIYEKGRGGTTPRAGPVAEAENRGGECELTCSRRTSSKRFQTRA